MDLNNIGIAEMRIIYAIAQMQPCSVRLINMAGCTGVTAASRPLLECIAKGLVERHKAPPVPKLTDEEKLEVELAGRDPFGKGRRPWIFSLTPAGEQVAAGLDTIVEGLNYGRRDRESTAVRQCGRANGVEKNIRA